MPVTAQSGKTACGIKEKGGQFGRESGIGLLTLEVFDILNALNAARQEFDSIGADLLTNFAVDVDRLFDQRATIIRHLWR